MSLDEQVVGHEGAAAAQMVAVDRALEELHGSPVAAWSLDRAGDRFWWSREVHEILGLDPARTPATLEAFTELLDPRTAARLHERHIDPGGTEMPIAECYWVTRPDGGRRLVEVHAWMTGPDGNLFGTCRDITDRALLRAEREELARRQASILRAAGEGVCGLGGDGRITFTNPALLRLMGREDEDLTGRCLHELVHRDATGDEDHEPAECPFAGVSNGDAVSIDERFRRRDGTRIEVGYMLVALDEQDGPGRVVSFRDITARRAASRLVQTSLRQVQILSAQRGALLGHLAEAEERERLRIAADLHDDTIQALGAVALRLSAAGERTPVDEVRDTLVDAEIDVRQVAERLRRVMVELVPPDETGDLRAAVGAYCAALFSSSGIAYEINGDVSGLDADACRIAYRLLQEALRNARRHSRGTHVRVELDAGAGQLVLRVTDDGVGMAGRETAPTHAGLRIVRQRVEAAGGEARFAPGPEGRGTTIELRLPSTVGRAA